MKQKILSLLVLLVAAVTGAWAQEPVPEYKLDKGTRQNCDIAFKVGAQDRTRANEGETVTITVTPNSGYATKNITVTAYMETGEMRVARRAPGDGGGAPASEIVEDITVNTTDNPNVFTIMMPKANVIVDAYTTRILQSSWIQNITAPTYNGQEQEPNIVVRDGATTLKLWNEETQTGDYTVAYSNNINAGTATVTITAVPGSNYSDPSPKASKTFTINRKAVANSMIQAIDDLTYTGSAQRPTITVKDAAILVDGQAKTLVEGTDYTVAYSDNVNAGTARVTITGIGNYRATATRNFTIQKKALEDDMIQSISAQTYNGSERRPAPTLRYGSLTLRASTDYTYAYTENVDAGTATVTVTARANSNYSGTASKTFTINPKALNNNMIQPIDDQTYTGSELEPAPVVRDAQIIVGGQAKTLVEGTDYTVAYTYNTNAGTATVTITGIGNYTGTASRNFTVLPKELEKSMVQPIADRVYTGLNIKPELTVRDGSKPLVKGVDYTTVYEDFTQAGTAKVTVTGIGNYTGTVVRNYNILQRSLADVMMEPIEDQTYTGDAIEPALKLTFDGQALKAGTDYTATYEDNVNAGTAKVTVTGKGNYSGTVTTNFSINARPATYLMIEPITPRTYSGYVIKPLITVRDGAKVLERNVDYTASYENFLNAGTATVTVTGIGNYRGSVSRTYTIKRKPLADEMIEAIADQSYTGEAIEPEITVKDEEIVLEGVVMTLVEGTDYTVAYSDNVNGGTATVTITGIGNFTGTATAEFTINPRTTIDGNITVEEDGEEVALTINDAGTQQGKTVEEDLEVTTLNYYRTLKASDVNAYTICLPYAPPTDPNLKYYTLTSVDGTALHFDEIEGEPQAFTPYLVMASADVDISKEGYKETFTMSKEVANTSVAGSYVMKGTLSGIQHDDAVGLYIMQAGNRWAKVGSNTKAYIPPFRAYIEVTSAVPERLDSTIGGENSATEITSVCATDEDGTEHWFDLSGHPIEKPTKSGIYIHNGRKEYVK